MARQPHIAGYSLVQVLEMALDTMRGSGVPFLVMGGIASNQLGRSRSTRDIDFFVRYEDKDKALEAFERAGFETSVYDPHWLYKAQMDDVGVDIIFRSTGEIFLDDTMFSRAVEETFKGLTVKLVPPEDLFVMKALATKEDTPRYWYDAVAIVGSSEFDWDYLVWRARKSGARRVLSALLFAQSLDLIVPNKPIRDLFNMIVGEESTVEPVREADE